MASIGILGGTFDPVHRAHIQVALTVLNSLSLDEVRLMPCQQSPTRSAPTASAKQRLAMLNLVANEHEKIRIDDRELYRNAPSYSVTSLRELRAEYPQAALFFIVGVDAFNSFLSWHQWQEIFKLAHCVVVERPGEQLIAEGELATELDKRGSEEKPSGLYGAIITGLKCELPHSSTAVRQALKTATSVEPLLEKPVSDYIQENRLYQ